MTDPVTEGRPPPTSRILIVEDDVLLTVVLADMVDELGYALAGTARTADAAVAAALRQKPDLVLMDVNLAHGSDGIEAAERIRRAQPTPIIFVTGRDDRATKMRAARAGAQAFVTKPFDYGEMARVLTQVLATAGRPM